MSSEKDVSFFLKRTFWKKDLTCVLLLSEAPEGELACFKHFFVVVRLDIEKRAIFFFNLYNINRLPWNWILSFIAFIIIKQSNSVCQCVNNMHISTTPSRDTIFTTQLLGKIRRDVFYKLHTRFSLDASFVKTCFLKQKRVSYGRRVL